MLDVTSQAIGELCINGDRACASGDLSELPAVARQLSAYFPEPLHCELAELVDACTSEPAQAIALWNRLKNRVYRPAKT